MFFEERFNWEFSPLIQLLLAREYGILVVNFPNQTKNSDSNDGKDESEISPETKYIIEAAKWCFDKRIAKVGNVSILSEGKSAAHAVRACSKHPKYFAGCMLLTPAFSERNDPIVDEDILAGFKKPLLILDHINDVERYIDFASMKKSRWGNMLSCIVYHKNPSDSLIAGVIEIGFAKMGKNPHSEEIPEKDLSDLTAPIDGLGVLKGETNRKGNEKEGDYGML
jgi:hypothetical protein